MAELTKELDLGKALLRVAQEANKTDQILMEAEQIVETFDREGVFYRFFCSPSVSNEEKKSVLRQIYEGHIEPELFNFLMTLIDRNSENLFKEVVRNYRILLDESQGVSTGIVYSVVPLSEERLEALKKRLEVHLTKKVKLLNRIDNTLIGGIRIFIDGQLIDA